MTKPAHDKIAAGLSNALAFAEGDETKGRIANAAASFPTLTSAQKRALLWLPEDGGWAYFTIRLHGPQIVSNDFVRIAALGLAENAIFGSSTNSNGQCNWHTARLTPAGQAARKAIEKEAAE